MREYPKILFITINGWNNTTGSATIPSIIAGYPSDRIASIFIRPDVPNASVCNKYFNISEKEVIKSLFSSSVRPGKVILSGENNDIAMHREQQDRIKLKKIPVSIGNVARDIVWLSGKWKNQSLHDFLDSFNADIIAFPAEGILSFLRLAEYVINYTGKPYMLFFWDDNFTFKSHGFSLYRLMVKNKIARLAKKCISSFAITPKMKKECIEYFGIDPVLITKPIILNKKTELKQNYPYPIKILYTGSLYIDRDKTILKLINAIAEINEFKQFFSLDIYTNSEIPEKKLKMFNVPKVAHLHEGVSKEEVLELQKKADVLLFAEALEGKYKNAARLSFSTKITDYLSANRAILAIGPSDIAPIEYLADNDIAIVVSEERKIRTVLQRILSEKDWILNKYANKAYAFGKQYHSRKIIFQTFCDSVMKARESMDEIEDESTTN